MNVLLDNFLIWFLPYLPLFFWMEAQFRKRETELFTKYFIRNAVFIIYLAFLYIVAKLTGWPILHFNG